MASLIDIVVRVSDQASRQIGQIERKLAELGVTSKLSSEHTEALGRHLAALPQGSEFSQMARDGELFGKALERDVKRASDLRGEIGALITEHQRLNKARIEVGRFSPYSAEDKAKVDAITAAVRDNRKELKALEQQLRPLEGQFAHAMSNLQQADRALSRLNFRSAALDVRHFSRELELAQINTQQIPRFFDQAAASLRRLGPEFSTAAAEVEKRSQDLRVALAAGAPSLRSQKFLQDTRDLRAAMLEVADGIKIADGTLDVHSRSLQRAADATFRSEHATAALRRTLGELVPLAQGLGHSELVGTLERIGAAFERDSLRAAVFRERMQRLSGEAAPPLAIIGRAALQLGNALRTSSTDIENFGNKLKDTTGIDETVGRSFRIIAQRSIIAGAAIFALIPIVGTAIGVLDNLAAAAVSVGGALVQLGGILATLPGFFAAAAGAAAGLLAVIQPLKLFGAAGQLFTASQQAGLKDRLGVGASGSSSAQADAAKQTAQQIQDAQTSLHNLRITDAHQEEEAERRLQEAKINGVRQLQEAEQALHDLRIQNAVDEKAKAGDVQNARARLAGLKAEGASPAELAAARADVKDAVLAQKEFRAQADAEEHKSANAVKDARLKNIQDVKDAEFALAEVRRNNALQERQAEEGILRLRQQQARQAKDAAASTDTLFNTQALALAGLDKQQRKVVFTLVALRKEFQRLTQPTRDLILGEFEKFLLFLGDHLPEITTLVDEFATRVADLAGAFISWLEKPQNFNQILTFFRDNEPIVTRMGRAAGHVADALFRIAQAAQPLTDFVSRGIERFAAGLDEAANTDTGSLASFFTHLIPLVRTVTGIVSNLGGILHNVISAAAPSGRELLGIFERWTEELDRTTGTARGLASMRRFFEEQVPVFRKLAEVTETFFHDLKQVGDALTRPPGDGRKPFLLDFLDQIQDHFLPFITRITIAFTQELGPAVLGLVEQFGTALENLLKPGGPLKLAIEGLTNLFRAFNAIPDPIRNTIVQIIGLVTVLKLFAPLFDLLVVSVRGVTSGFAFFSQELELAGARFVSLRAGANLVAVLLGGKFKAPLVFLLLLLPVLRNLLGAVGDAFDRIADILSPLGDLLDALPGPLHSLVSEIGSAVALLILPQAAILGFRRFFTFVEAGFQRFLRAIGLGAAADALLAEKTATTATEMELLTAAIQENTAALQGNQVAEAEVAVEMEGLSAEAAALATELGVTAEQMTAAVAATGELGAVSAAAATELAAVGAAAAAATPEVEAFGAAEAVVVTETEVGLLAGIAGGLTAIGEAIVAALPFVEGLGVALGVAFNALLLGLPLLIAFATNMFGIRDATLSALGAVGDFFGSIGGSIADATGSIGDFFQHTVLGMSDDAKEAGAKGIGEPTIAGAVEAIEKNGDRKIPAALGFLFNKAQIAARQHSVTFGFTVGDTMARNVILGLRPLPTNLSSAMRTALEAARQTIQTEQNTILTSFDDFAARAQEALGIIQGGQKTQAGAKLDAIQLKHEHTTILQQIHDAEVQLQQAQASGDKTRILEAQRSLNDARYQLTVFRLQREDEAERKSLEKRQRNQQRAIADGLEKLRKQLEEGQLTPVDFDRKVRQLLRKNGVNWHTLGHFLGNQYRTGFFGQLQELERQYDHFFSHVQSLSLHTPTAQNKAVDTLVADLRAGAGPGQIQADITEIKKRFTDLALARRRIADAMAEAVGGVVQNGKVVVGGRGGAGGDPVIRGVVRSVGDILDALKSPKLIKQAKDSGEKLGDIWGSSIGAGFFPAVRFPFKESKLQKMLEGVVGNFKKASKSSSPSKLFMPIGEWLADGIVAGFKGTGNARGLGEKLTDYFTKTLPKSFEIAQKAFHPLWKSILTDARSFFDDLLHTIRGGWGSVLTYFTKTIPGTFDAIESGIGHLWTRLGKDVDKGWGYITNQLGQWAENLVQIMSEVLHRVGAHKLTKLQLPVAPSTNAPSFASGGVPYVGAYGHGIVRPVPGGVFRVAEAGSPEAILSLDPRHRDRSLQILDFAYRKLVGFADGGVTDPDKAGPRFRGLGIPKIPGFDQVGGVVKEIAVDAAKMLRAAVGKWFGASLLGETGKGGHVPSIAITAKHALANVRLGSALAKRYGWGSGPEFDSLYQLWAHESGWSEFAYNPSSGAQGIPQFLPGLVGRPTPSGFPSTPPVRSANQINWGLGYIHGGYGDPITAWLKWQSRDPHWYHGGGIVPGTSQDVPAMLRSQEMVLTERHQRLLGSMLFGNMTLPAPGGPQRPLPTGQQWENVVHKAMLLIHHVFEHLRGILGAGHLPGINVLPFGTNFFSRTRLFRGAHTPFNPGSRIIDFSRRAIHGIAMHDSYALGALVHELAHAFQLNDIIKRGPVFYEGGAEQFMKSYAPGVFAKLKIPFNLASAEVPAYEADLAKLSQFFAGRPEVLNRRQFGRGGVASALQRRLVQLDNQRIITRNRLAISVRRLNAFNATGAAGTAADAIRARLEAIVAHDQSAYNGAQSAYFRFVKQHPELGVKGILPDRTLDGGGFTGRKPFEPPDITRTRGDSFGMGGVIAGGSFGEPVPITAHVGEWVVNAEQQARLAAALGGWENAKQMLFNKTVRDPIGSNYASGGPVLRARPGAAAAGVEQNITIHTASPTVDVDYVSRVMEQRMGRW